MGTKKTRQTPVETIGSFGARRVLEMVILALCLLASACSRISDSGSEAPETRSGASSEKGTTREKDRADPAANVVSSGGSRRSLLLVTVDTTRVDRLEPYGATDVATPNLSKLAREGLTFEAAYAVSPLTLVSHSSILSGLFPSQHGVRNNGTHYLPAKVTTLAEDFRAAGYRTAAFVSAAVLERRYGLNQGFEVYDDDLSTGRTRHPRMVPDRPAVATVDSALAWLEQVPEGQPFFVWVHLYDPHAAYSPPPPYRDTYRERLYDGEIAYMDSQMGRLFEHERLGGSRDVVVAVIGDHGESLGEHGERTHGILAYDSTLHVPFILKVPGGPRGGRAARVVSQVDFVPTMLELFELPSRSRWGAEEQAGDGGEASRGELAGTSLARLLEGSISGGAATGAFGRRGGARERRQDGVGSGGAPEGRGGAGEAGAGSSAPWHRAGEGIYSESYLPFYTYGWAKLKVFRRGRWKFIDAPRRELYDLGRDPLELSNLALQRPDLAHDLERDLGEFLERLGGADLEQTMALDADAESALMALGYLAVGSGGKRKDAGRMDPKDGIALHVTLEAAHQLERDGFYKLAEKKLNEVLKTDPNNLAALVDLAGVIESDGRIDEAIDVTERALALDPEFPRTYLLMSRLEARRGNTGKALELVRVALDIDPDLLPARLQEVSLLAQDGAATEARARAEALLDAFPQDARVLLMHAQIVELAGGDVAGGESRVRQALARDPFLVKAWRTLGSVLEARNDSEGAAEAYRDGLRREPDSAPVHAALGLLLARTGAAGAPFHLREAIRLTRAFRADLHVALGGWLAEHDRYDEAEAEYNKVLELDPRHPGARNNQAIAMYRTGRIAEAEAQLSELVLEFPNYADAHNNLAAIAVESQSWELAERHARTALRLNPLAVEAWNNLGLAAEEQGRLDEAIDAYQQALVLDAGYWPACHNLGIALARAGRPQEAAYAFEDVLERLPQHAETHFQLAELYAGPLEDPQRARQHYNAFLRRAPRDPRARAARKRVAELVGPAASRAE